MGQNLKKKQIFMCVTFKLDITGGPALSPLWSS